MQKRMARIEETLNDVKNARDRMGMSRQTVHDRIEKDRADLDVQFKRIAAMQAEIDILTPERQHLKRRAIASRSKTAPARSRLLEPAKAATVFEPYLAKPSRIRF